MVAHCLFEQSGTFKNEFKKLGIEAYDYDILNDYGETDYQVDLFAEIDKAYRGGVPYSTTFPKMMLYLLFSHARGLKLKYTYGSGVKHCNRKITQILQSLKRI